MATSTGQSGLDGRIERIDELVQRLEDVADPVTRATARELLQSLMALHGAALERVVDVVQAGGSVGREMLETLAQDDLVSGVLVLYDLHPVDVKTRVEQALEKTRPYLRSHGGNVELVAVDAGESVRLRLQGSCHGCPSSALTLKMAIEDAIRNAAPEVTSIIVVDTLKREEGESLRAPVLLTHARGPEPDVYGSVWESVEDMEQLSSPGVHAISVGGQDVVVCRLTEALYAYASKCPACDSALGTAFLAGRSLTCASCKGSYDVVKAGRGITQPTHYLQPLPLLMEGGRARIALPRTHVAMEVTLQ